MDTKEFRWWFMPYCLEEVSPDRYVVLNRGYKPLGIVTEKWVDYNLYAVQIKITANIAKSLSIHGDANTRKIYLYDDATVPTSGAKNMKKYLEILEKLSKYNVSL